VDTSLRRLSVERHQCEYSRHALHHFTVVWTRCDDASSHATIKAQRDWVTRLVHEIVGVVESNDDIKAARPCLESKVVKFLLESLLDIVGRMLQGPT